MPIDKVSLKNNYEAFIYNIYAPQVFGEQLRCGKAKSSGKSSHSASHFSAENSGNKSTLSKFS